MLFFISEELAQKAVNGDGAIIDALSSLGYFWRTGCCLVDGSRATLEALKNIGILESDYNLILSRKQDVTGLYKKIDFFVVLQARNGVSDKLIEGAVGKSVVIDEFENRIKFALNVVLCENIRDYDLYLWGAKRFCDIDAQIFRLNTLGYNGGGAVIIESAKHLSDFPCLTICDNDKKYPEDDEGDTIKDLKLYYITSNLMLTWKYELKVHEIENLIPLSLLCLVWGSKGLVKKMKALKSNPNYGAFFSFFDFKEGFKKSTLRKMDNGAIPSLHNYIAMLKSLGITQQKINTTLASRYKKSEPALLQGVSKDLLKLTVEFIGSNYLDDTIIPDNHQTEDWKNITRKIWSIGCANNPRRV
jgi:hypothetical protein